MRKLLPVFVALVAIGCSEPAPKADTGAPAPTYKMVPATTGGAGARTSATSTASPTPPPSNPPAPGSD